MGDHVTVGGTGDDGASVPGYFSGGGGAGVLVVHDKWGLTAHIVDVVERVAAAGFSALAVDLFHGRTATGDRDVIADATAVARDLDHREALADLGLAVDHLIGVTENHRVGVVGYGLGGALAWRLAAARPDAIVAAAPYYGLVDEADAIDWAALGAKVVGEFAERDEAAPPAAAAALQDDLRSRNKDVTINVHQGVGHGFFDDARPEAYAAEPALEAWERTLSLLREQLDDG